MKAIIELNTGKSVDFELSILSMHGLKATPVIGVWKGVKSHAYILSPRPNQIKEVIRIAKAHHQEAVLWMDEHNICKLGYKERNYFPVGKAMRVKQMSPERAANLEAYTLYQGSAYVAA